MSTAKFPRSDRCHSWASKPWQESGQTPQFFLDRHVSGDWGQVDAEDWQLNDEASRKAPGSYQPTRR